METEAEKKAASTKKIVAIIIASTVSILVLAGLIFPELRAYAMEASRAMVGAIPNLVSK